MGVDVCFRKCDSPRKTGRYSDRCFPQGGSKWRGSRVRSRRLRGFQSPDVLLRMLMLHVARGYSLRETVGRPRLATGPIFQMWPCSNGCLTARSGYDSCVSSCFGKSWPIRSMNVSIARSGLWMAQSSDSQVRPAANGEFCTVSGCRVWNVTFSSDSHDWQRQRRIIEPSACGSARTYSRRMPATARSLGLSMFGEMCREVEPSAYIASAALERRNASLEVHGSADWRAAVVCAAHNRYPQVSPTDSSLEAAARREVVEETHFEISAFEYIGSNLVDEWRYRNEIDKVMTTVFLARYMYGAIQPDDNIEELKWYLLSRTFDFGCVVASHKPLLSGVLDAIERSSTKQLKEGTIHELPAENR
jgi:hypothetical protein